jgi:hypothetical protein
MRSVAIVRLHAHVDPAEEQAPRRDRPRGRLRRRRLLPRDRARDRPARPGRDRDRRCLSDAAPARARRAPPAGPAAGRAALHAVLGRADQRRAVSRPECPRLRPRRRRPRDPGARAPRGATPRDRLRHGRGPSTDVSIVDEKPLERAFESSVGGVRVKAPMLRIHTVAAAAARSAASTAAVSPSAPRAPAPIPVPSVMPGGMSPASCAAAR